MKQYKVVKELDHQSWAHFVTQHPEGNVFQSPVIMELLGKTENYMPLFFAVVETGGQATNGEKIVDNTVVKGVLVAVIQKESTGIKGYFTSRTIVWGGPLIDGGDSEEEEKLLDILLTAFIKGVRSKSIYIQLRNQFDMSRYAVAFKKKGFELGDHLNCITDMESREITEKKISKSKMRQVRKSFKSGATIIEPRNIDDVKQFYSILQDLYRTKVKRPLPPWSFFEAFYQLSLEGRLGKYFLVEMKSEIIGGIMSPITDDRAIYEWYIGGRDGVHNGVYPSVLATWAPIDYALEKGLKCFDFMGAGKPDEDYGVREFKTKFGSRVVNFGRFERINNKPLYSLGKLGLRLLGGLKK